MLKRSPLTCTAVMLLSLMVASTGCKKKSADITPTPPMEETAVPAPTETRPSEIPTQEVTDNKFKSDAIEEEQPTRSELAERLEAQLKTVFFGYDKSDLSDVTLRVLQDNARVLKLNPGLDVVIEGHCDERGTIEYNLALGQRRAASVRDYLIGLGVDANRLRTVSYGEERPVANGNDESAWSRNRRGQFVVE